jgi:uncharacterized protein YceH (UPF0502 family)
MFGSMENTPPPESPPEETGNPAEESPGESPAWTLTPEEARVLGCATVHLLAGEPGEEPATAGGPADVAAVDWRETMEQELAALRSEVESLRRDLDEFRGQFE